MTRINRRAFLRASGGAATIGVLAGCSGDGGDGGGDGGDGSDGGGDGGDGGDGGSTGTPGGSMEPVTIGGLEPISGPFAPWSTVHRDGLQFAVQEVNENGGVLGGRDLEVVIADTGADPAEADSAFRRQVEQESNVVATTGAVSSDVGIRVSQTAGDLEVPHVHHMAGADEIITQDTRYMFRMGIIPGSSYMQAQATAFADAGYTEVGAVIADYAWGRSAEAAMNEYFDVDVNIQVAPIGASDFSSYIRQMSDDLEMMITSGHPPGSVGIANQTLELGLEPEVITGASTPPQLLAGALSDAARDRYVHIHNSNPYSDAFAEAASAFGEANDAQFNTHTAYGYITGKMIAAAVEEAGEASGQAVGEALHNIEFDSLFVNPIQYNEYGELDQIVVQYSDLLSEAPSYYSGGSYSFEEVTRSAAIAGRTPSE